MTMAGDVREGEIVDEKPPPPRAKPLFANYMDFFGWFARTFRRDLEDENKVAWCSEWWRHAEAVQIIRALHESFETHWAGRPVPKGSGRADWLIYYCYPLINRLFDPHGVFNGCAPEYGGHVTNRTSILPMAIDPTGHYPID